MVAFPIQMGLFIERQPVTAENLNEDVLGHVFGFVKDDPETLKACSFVCKSWCSASRPFIFNRIQVRPEKIFSADLLDQHPMAPKNIRHVRSLDRYNAPSALFKSCPAWGMTSRVLTALTLRKTITEFEDIVSVLSDVPRLESLALIDIAFPMPLVSRRTDFSGRFLPRCMRRLRLRNVTSLIPFFLWLSAHADGALPALTHIDCGPLQEHDFFTGERVFARVAASLRHVVLSFAPRVLGHVCADNQDIYEYIAFDKTAALLPRGPQRNQARFRQVFGVPHCLIFCMMDNLTVLHIDEFADDSYTLKQGLLTTAELIAPRICASVPGTHLKRLVFGMDISSVARLSQYNINWSFFDEIFVSEAYARVQSIEFRNAGRAKIDNIADYISARLPKTAGRNLLLFGKADPNLVADYYS